MLLRFEVSNHRSISDPVELSMIAVDEDRPATRGFERLDERVLTVAGIYGPNASGKSNVIEAMAWLSAAVGRSLRAWDEYVPRVPFKFAGGPAMDSTYEIEMVEGGVRYSYRLEVDDEGVLFEGLYSYPERRRRMLFEREGMDVGFRRGFEGAVGTRELLTPTALALSAAARFGAAEARALHRSLSRFGQLGLLRSPRWMRSSPSGQELGPESTLRLLTGRGADWPPAEVGEVDPEARADREMALAMLRFADLGIDDVTVVDEPEPDAALLGDRPRRAYLRFLHRVGGDELPFAFTEESAGTQTWYTLIGPVLGSLQAGRVLLFDEIDASLHPRLSARIVELFQDPETNPHGAQLIFTSHDTSLLNYLNRDEVWLTEKGDDGATTLTALAEYGGDKVRRSLNLEKAYLQGRFGAVPEVDQFVLRRALGLATSD